MFDISKDVLMGIARGIVFRNQLRNKPIGVSGKWDFILVDEHGREKQRLTKKNLVVTSGVELLMNSLGSFAGRPSVISHIAIGSGSTAPASAQTTLASQLAIAAATYSYSSGSLEGVWSATFPPGTGTGDIREGGMFNAAAAGTMFNRVVTDLIAKQAGDALTVEMRLSITTA